MTEPGKSSSFEPLSGEILKESPDEDKLAMNFNKQANLKRAHLKVLREAHRAPFGKVVIGLLDKEGSEAGIRVADPEEADAMPIHKSKTDTGAKISLTRLVRKFPALKVAKGRVRLFPISQRVIDGKTCLVLDLVNTTVALANSRGDTKDDTKGDVAASQDEES